MSCEMTVIANAVKMEEDERKMDQDIRAMDEQITEASILSANSYALSEYNKNRKIVIRNCSPTFDEVNEFLNGIESADININKKNKRVVVTMKKGEAVEEAVKVLSERRLAGEPVDVAIYPSNNVLCVARLPPDMNDDNFGQFAGRFGDVIRCAIIRSCSGESKCFGFIEYRGSRDSPSEEISQRIDGMHYPLLTSRDPTTGLKTSERAEATVSDEHTVNDNSTTILQCSFLTSQLVDFKQIQCTCLLVENLPKEFEDDKRLREMFSCVAEPIYCRVARSSEGISNFAVVDFSSGVVAEKTYERLNGTAELDDSKIKVFYCIPGQTAAAVISWNLLKRKKKVVLEELPVIPPKIDSMLLDLLHPFPSVIKKLEELLEKLQHVVNKQMGPKNLPNFTAPDAGLLGSAPSDSSSNPLSQLCCQTTFLSILLATRIQEIEPKIITEITQALPIGFDIQAVFGNPILHQCNTMMQNVCDDDSAEMRTESEGREPVSAAMLKSLPQLLTYLDCYFSSSATVDAATVKTATTAAGNTSGGLLAEPPQSLIGKFSSSDELPKPTGAPDGILGDPPGCKTEPLLEGVSSQGSRNSSSLLGSSDNKKPIPPEEAGNDGILGAPPSNSADIRHPLLVNMKSKLAQTPRVSLASPILSAVIDWLIEEDLSKRIVLQKKCLGPVTTAVPDLSTTMGSGNGIMGSHPSTGAGIMGEPPSSATGIMGEPPSCGNGIMGEPPSRGNGLMGEVPDLASALGLRGAAGQEGVGDGLLGSGPAGSQVGRGGMVGGVPVATVETPESKSAGVTSILGTPPHQPEYWNMQNPASYIASIYGAFAQSAAQQGTDGTSFKAKDECFDSPAVWQEKARKWAMECSQQQQQYSSDQQQQYSNDQQQQYDSYAQQQQQYGNYAMSSGSYDAYGRAVSDPYYQSYPNSTGYQDASGYMTGGSTAGYESYTDAYSNTATDRQQDQYGYDYNSKNRLQPQQQQQQEYSSTKLLMDSSNPSFSFYDNTVGNTGFNVYGSGSSGMYGSSSGVKADGYGGNTSNYQQPYGATGMGGYSGGGYTGSGGGYDANGYYYNSSGIQDPTSLAQTGYTGGMDGSSSSYQTTGGYGSGRDDSGASRAEWNAGAASGWESNTQQNYSTAGYSTTSSRQDVVGQTEHSLKSSENVYHTGISQQEQQLTSTYDAAEHAYVDNRTSTGDIGGNTVGRKRGYDANSIGGVSDSFKRPPLPPFSDQQKRGRFN